MPLFGYKELRGAGRRGCGTIEATSAADARRRLRAAGVHVVEVIEGQKQTQQAQWGASRAIGLLGRGRQDLSTATWHLASLLRAGTPLVPALSALAEQLGHRPLGRIFAQVRDKVNEGISLAQAMQEHPAVFSEIYVSMVGAGEATGALEDILSRLAEMSKRSNTLVNKVKAALAYPIFMAVAGIGVVIFLFAFVIPSITKLFLEMGRELPWPTILLMEVGSFTQHYIWMFMAVVGGTTAALVFWIRTESGQRVWDRLKLKCPLVGNLLLKVAISRFSRTLAVLLASGLTIVEALDLARRVVGNIAISDVVEEAAKKITRGVRIADAFQSSGVFPPVVVHIIAAGEKSGGFEEGLTNMADVFDNEIEEAAKALTSLLEPLMILLLGIVVGFIVLAILLPIFDINQAIV